MQTLEIGPYNPITNTLVGVDELIVLDEPELDDSHYVDLGIKRKFLGLNKSLKSSFLLAAIFFLMYLLLEGDIGLVFISYLILVCFTIVVNVRYKAHTYSISHYNDLASWSVGRSRNSSLYHAMRARLYRKFYSQYAYTDEARVVFINTLNFAYSDIYGSPLQ
jgi:hypothetical protein